MLDFVSKFVDMILISESIRINNMPTYSARHCDDLWVASLCIFVYLDNHSEEDDYGSIEKIGGIGGLES